MNYKKLLQEAIDAKYQTMAANVITLAVMEGEPVEEWTDLHFKAMLLLAAPISKKKKAGRPKAYSEIDHRWFSYVCAVKAFIDGKSFSSTWQEYADHVTRQLKPDDSPVLLAKLIKLAISDADINAALEDGSNVTLMRFDEVTDSATKAIKLFKVSEHDIDQIIFNSVVK